MQELMEEMKKWLAAYIKSFYSGNQEVQQAVDIKEEHTAKVTEICRELAFVLGLEEKDCQLVEMMGLFHDVGRFPQFAKYKTFNDSISENHALLGLKVLEEVPFLAQLAPEDLVLFKFAIGNHNAKQINPDGTKRQQLFARILRDADKLDIYRVLSPFLQPSDGSGCSPDFVRLFASGEQCDYSQIRTMDDRKLVRLMWVYDVNFTWTLQKIVERGYTKRIMECLPVNEALEPGLDRLQAYIKQRLQAAEIA